MSPRRRLWTPESAGQRYRGPNASFLTLTFPTGHTSTKEASMLIPKRAGATAVKLALLMMMATATVAAEPVSFASFDIPGATSYFVAGINDEGLVAGTWVTAAGSDVGFTRSPDGNICTPIVDPNDDSGVTVLRAVDDEGVI